MKIVDLVQGTPEWHAHRATHFNASDAPAMLGLSPYKTRAQLLREIATGITPDIDAATQRRFDDGHRYEALARPLAEEIVGEDLYPCVGTEGKYSASFDGLTLLEDTAFEHKSLNDDLRKCVTGINDGDRLPEQYRVQMEQQCMVSGAERALFMASKWNGDDLVEERHCWYVPDPDLRARIIDGWEQFEADVAAYVPQSATPSATGITPDALPVLSVVARGMVEFSNLEEFREKALAAIGAVNRDLQTDDDFATAELTIKAFKSGEEKLDATKRQVLGQMADVDTVMRTIDEVSEQMRRVRLDLDKLVKAEKESRKGEIVAAGREAVRAHYDNINATLGEYGLLPPASLTADLGAAIKGKKSLSSMRDAVDAAVANAKIAASQQAERVRANVVSLAEHADHASLFADRLMLCEFKQPEDLRNLVAARIAEHQQRETEKLEAERERIRKEEVAKLERQQQDEDDRIERERVQQTPAAGVPVAQQPLDDAAKNPGVATGSRNASPSESVTHGSLPPAIHSATPSGARIKLGDINDRIAPLSITADGLQTLGFAPVGTERSAKLYAERDFPAICDALIGVLQRATRAEAA